MPLHVAVLGASGHLAKAVLHEFYALHQSGQIRLTIISRTGSVHPGKFEDVELRQLDLITCDDIAIEYAIRGIEVLISTVGGEAIAAQNRLVPALSNLDCLKTFVPSDFGCLWDEKEIASMQSPLLRDKSEVARNAHIAGVTTTIVHAGLIGEVLFSFPISGWNVKQNSIVIWRGRQDIAVPFSSYDHIAKALAEMITWPIKDYAGERLVAVEYEATNSDIAKMLEKLHGCPPELIPISDDELDAKLRSHGFGGYESLGAGLIRRAGDFGHHYVRELKRIDVIEWQGGSLEQELGDALRRS